MFSRRNIIIALILAAIAIPAYAAAVATQMIPGFMTTSSCPGSASSCWKAYSSASPIPVSLSITP